MSKSKKIILWLLLGILVPVLAFMVTKFLTFINYKCPWRYLCHILCAGCGVTRMVKMLFKLEFYKAFLYNPLFFILTIFLILYYFYVLICLIFNKKIFKFKLKHLYIIGSIMILFMIVRNIPGTFLYDIWPKK